MSVSLALACALAREPVVAKTLARPSTQIVIAAPRGMNNRLFPGEVQCAATRADGMTVVIGLAPHGSIARRSAMAKGTGFWSDDGALIPGLGDGAVNSYLAGVSVRRGSTFLRVAVYPGGKAQQEIVEAEGILPANREDSERLARALVAKLPKSP